jgi:hypothetical protein
MAERDAALLTNAQRAYIKGEKEYRGKVEQDMIRRIRARLYNSMLDLSLAVREFPIDEIDTAFESPPPGTPGPPEQPHATEAMSDFFALKYLVHRDIELESGQTEGWRLAMDAEDGLELALNDLLGVNATVSVDVDITRRGRLENLAEETDDYADLSLDQLEALRQNEYIAPSDYAEAFLTKDKRGDLDV